MSTESDSPAADWDAFDLEGETSVERLKYITSELDVLTQARGLRRSFEEYQQMGWRTHSASTLVKLLELLS